jgi:aspartyl-tRNA synthetase
VRAIPAPKGGSRKFADRMNAFAQKEGLPGMGYIFWRARQHDPLAEAKRAAIKDVLRQGLRSGNVLTQLSAEEQLNELEAEAGATAGSLSAEEVRSVMERLEHHRLNNEVEEADFLISAYFGDFEAAGPIAKALGRERTEAIRQQLGLGLGDAAFFLGGKPETFEAVAGRARNEIGRELKLTEEGTFRFAWIVDFPMYEKTDEGGIDFSHNPFSMPQGGLEALNGDPLEVYAYQYDLACNGYELISGGIRNHKPEIMYKAFELAGYPNSEVDKRFGGMVKAFKYGAPPHGGCAAGIDRIVMLLADEANIREVIMFPMNQRAEDLLMGAPSEPTNTQLRELSLRVVPKDA